MAAHGTARAAAVGRAAARERPDLLKEIFYGLTVAIAGAIPFKIYHKNERRKVEEFYDLLEKGDISVEIGD